MKIGDLVRNLNSESRELGIIVAFVNSEALGKHPLVAWSDRTGFTMSDYLEIINENR